MSAEMIRHHPFPYVCNLCLTMVTSFDSHGLGECVDCCGCTWNPEDESKCKNCLGTGSPEVFRLKSIGLDQPWGDALVRGIKRYETRPSRWHHRGPLAIHANLNPFRPGRYDINFVSALDKLGLLNPEIRYGGIIGIVDVQDCQPTDLRPIPPTEEMLGNYEPGRWQSLCKPIRNFPGIIPCRGQQGFFYVDINKKAVEPQNV